MTEENEGEVGRQLRDGTGRYESIPEFEVISERIQDLERETQRLVERILANAQSSSARQGVASLVAAVLDAPASEDSYQLNRALEVLVDNPITGDRDMLIVSAHPPAPSADQIAAAKLKMVIAAKRGKEVEPWVREIAEGRLPSGRQGNQA